MRPGNRLINERWLRGAAGREGSMTGEKKRSAMLNACKTTK